VIAKIDTEAVAGAAAPAPAAAAPAAAPRRPQLRRPPPLPAARPTWPCRPPPSCWPTTSCRRLVAGTGKDGRVTKGDVLGAVAGGAKPAAIPTGAPTSAAAGGRARRPSLGDRPEQRVPMTRLRARVAERLLQSQSTNAILTTFNEVNMAPVMDMRKKFQDKFEKEHGVKLGFMSFFVKAAVHALKKFPASTPRSTATTSSTTATSTSASPSARRAAWWCPSCATPTR
jgi:2-oxoglutarate dehydrogenase E2 component (dihydrolipoamide succinyltransferase)